MQLAVAERTREREKRPGWWVRAARKSCGKTQMDLGLLTHRDKSAVGRWEAKGGTIDYIAFVGILNLLGLPADWEPTAEMELMWKNPGNDAED